MRMRLFWLGLGCIFLTNRPVALAQGETGRRWTPREIVGDPSLMGQVVECAGVVDRIEKDGLSATTFFVVLEGDLYCRVLLEPFQAGGRKVEFKKPAHGVVALYVGGMRVLAPGEEITVRGTVRAEMKRTVLHKSTIRASSNVHVRAILGLGWMLPTSPPAPAPVSQPGAP